MSVNPGFAGQGFIDITEKVKGLRSQFKGIIEVDGGITNKNAKLVKDAGADSLVSGSYIFKSENPSKTLSELKALLS